MLEIPPRVKEGKKLVARTTRNTHKIMLDLVTAQKPTRVLDAACAHGMFAWKLVQQGIEAYCFDCNPDGFMLEGVDFRVGDLTRPPLDYPDGFFDTVACVDGIEHLENPFQAIREFCRILRPGGLLVMSTPNVNLISSRLRFLLTCHHTKFKRPLNEAKPDPDHHIMPIAFPWLRYMLHTNGFRITAVRTNQMRASGLLCAWLWPFVALLTWNMYRREKKYPAQRLRNREILATLLSPALFFGETLVVAAEKIQAHLLQSPEKHATKLAD